MGGAIYGRWVMILRTLMFFNSAISQYSNKIKIWLASNVTQMPV